MFKETQKAGQFYYLTPMRQEQDVSVKETANSKSKAKNRSSGSLQQMIVAPWNLKLQNERKKDLRREAPPHRSKRNHYRQKTKYVQYLPDVPIHQATSSQSSQECRTSERLEELIQTRNGLKSQLAEFNEQLTNDLFALSTDVAAAFQNAKHSIDDMQYQIIGLREELLATNIELQEARKARPKKFTLNLFMSSKI